MDKLFEDLRLIYNLNAAHIIKFSLAMVGDKTNYSNVNVYKQATCFY